MKFRQIKFNMKHVSVRIFNPCCYFPQYLPDIDRYGMEPAYQSMTLMTAPALTGPTLLIKQSVMFAKQHYSCWHTDVFAENVGT